MASKTIFAFIDLKDPFMAAEIVGEERPGPILSLLEARRFDNLNLFYTPALKEHAEATHRELGQRHPGCELALYELPIADPKDYSAVMGSLAREVRQIARFGAPGENFVCVSSGTAEMRAVWFLITAARILPAILLQVGSPAEPLFGAANVKEVRFDAGDWGSLRDLLMPMDFFAPKMPSKEMPDADRDVLFSRASLSELRETKAAAHAELSRAVLAKAEETPYEELDAALQELGIFVGSAVLRHAAERVALVADTDYPVFILGETGTGKELFARLVHRLSGRRARPWVTANCAAGTKDLMESYLFGHTKGAFTGATSDRKGIFEQADGGTLFLDEIGELPLEVQAKLLRIVQDGMLQPVGSSRPRHVDVRIVAATNRNLKQEVAAARFREDLYFRLEVVQIRLPALRERLGEIPRLAAALLKQINQRRQHPRQLSKDALRRLELHSWPGNIRELTNVLQRSVLFSGSGVLRPEDLIIDNVGGTDPLAGLPEPREGFSLEEYLAEVRKQLFLRALERSGGNQAAAAKLLGVSKQAVNKFFGRESDSPD
jgi:DNA-binding NtrC family response regulator